MTPGARPRSVVFADVEPWEGFLQFAAALRRRGVHVSRLTSIHRGAARRVNDAVQRLVFHETRACVTPDGHVAGTLPVWDDHLLEAVDEVAAALLAQGPAPLRTRDRDTEHLLHDKLRMNDYAAALGIAVPGSWAAEDGPRHPVVRKPRLGAGGQDVEFVSDAAHAERVFDRAVAEPGRWMVQDRAPGTTLHVGGVARGGTLVAVAVCEAAPAPDGHFGPTAEIRILDDEAAVAATADLLTGLHYTGAFCLDFVRAADGTPLLVDVNARVFGSWLPLQVAGLDIVGSYLAVHGMGGPPTPSRLQPGQVVRVLSPGPTLSGRGGMLTSARDQLIGTARAARVLGGRWVVVNVVRLVMELARQVVGRAVGSGRGGSSSC